MGCSFDPHGRAATFRWFTGDISALQQMIDSGHHLSINPAMLSSSKGRGIIGRVPRNRVLFETDGPYCRVAKMPAGPWDIAGVARGLATVWECSVETATLQVRTSADTSRSTDELVGCIAVDWDAKGLVMRDKLLAKVRFPTSPVNLKFSCKHEKQKSRHHRRLTETFGAVRSCDLQVEHSMWWALRRASQIVTAIDGGSKRLVVR
jgi:hypothetical protein